MSLKTFWKTRCLNQALASRDYPDVLSSIITLARNEYKDDVAIQALIKNAESVLKECAPEQHLALLSFYARKHNLYVTSQNSAEWKVLSEALDELFKKDPKTAIKYSFDITTDAKEDELLAAINDGLISVSGLGASKTNPLALDAQKKFVEFIEKYSKQGPQAVIYACDFLAQSSQSLNKSEFLSQTSFFETVNGLKQNLEKLKPATLPALRIGA